MKRASQYIALCVFFVSIPLLFNVQIKNFQISSRSKNISDAVKKENLIGKRKDIVVESLKNVFKEENFDKLDADEQNEIVFSFNRVASSFDFTDGPTDWDIWLILRFDRKNNRLIDYDLTDFSNDHF